VLLLAVICSCGVFAQQAAPAGDLRAKLQAALDEGRRGAKFPGASLGVVLKNGEAIGLASGLADRAAKRALTPDDLLMTGSTGKTFFAAVALTLIRVGR